MHVEDYCLRYSKSPVVLISVYLAVVVEMVVAIVVLPLLLLSYSLPLLNALERTWILKRNNPEF